MLALIGGLFLFWPLREVVVGSAGEEAAQWGKRLAGLLTFAQVEDSGGAGEGLPRENGRSEFGAAGASAAEDAEEPSPADAPAPAKAPLTSSGAKPSTIVVSEAKVLDWALAGVVPRGVPRASTGGGPAGVELHGVGGLGVGLEDGDVLVKVGGTPVSDASAVADFVLQARGRHERTIEALVARPRGTQTSYLRLIVEQPYPTEDEIEERLTRREGPLGSEGALNSGAVRSFRPETAERKP